MRINQSVHQSVGGVGCKGTMDDLDLPKLEEAYADEVVDMCGQRHRTVNENAKISDWFGGLDVGIKYPDLACRTMLETKTRS